MAKYKCIVEYEYPVDHKPPVKAEIILHGDSVTSNNVTPFTDRPHGEWIYHAEWELDGECAYECSRCGMGTDVDYNFCPNCGSDNRKEGDEE